jgi:hypothetical protein
MTESPVFSLYEVLVTAAAGIASVGVAVFKWVAGRLQSTIDDHDKRISILEKHGITRQDLETLFEKHECKEMRGLDRIHERLDELYLRLPKRAGDEAA